MLILNAADVRQAVPMADAIDAVAAAYRQLATGQATVPLRTAVAQSEHEAHTFVMPAHLAEGGALGLKVVSVFPHNQQRHDLPSIHALMVVLDAATGRPVAAMDGTYLTALRTGAGSGAATRALARKDAATLVVFGAGAQARTQVLAVCAVRPITRILIVNRTPARAQALVAQLRADGVAATAEQSDAATALTLADVVCCATTATAPLFRADDVRPGTHINGVGSFTPQMAEVPAGLLARARVFVDQHSAAWAEAGDLIQARDAGVLDQAATMEIGRVLGGDITGRVANSDITFFKSVGNAAQDVAVAQVALERAKRLGLGQEVSL